MTLEVATYINDLQPVNPTSVDPVNQGDDHLRLIKQVLQNTFANASRQFQIPIARAVAASTTLLKSDGNGMILCSTGAGAVQLTMPALVALDAGWMVSIMKTSSDVNPMFIAPPSGNISSAGVSVARARRAITGKRFMVVWDGANWTCERINSEPIGVMLDYWGAGAPAGWEWPNGQTLVSGNYPEYLAILGGLGTPDVRGNSIMTLDNLGGAAAGRCTSNFINPTALGSRGGLDYNYLTAAQMPQHLHNVAAADPGHAHGVSHNAQYYNASSSTGGGGFADVYPGGATISVAGAGTGIYLSSSAGTNVTDYQGSSSFHSNLQPTLIAGKLLVVE